MAKSSRLYMTLAVSTHILSLLDFIYTMVGLTIIPGSYEANPVFNNMLLRDPTFAMIFKLLLVPVFLYLMYHWRTHSVARFGLWVCFLAYLAFDAWALYKVLTYWSVFLG